jgi:hypothetical protein
MRGWAILLLAVAALSACTPPPPSTATLPRELGAPGGGGDPTLDVLQRLNGYFLRPPPGDPAAAALAFAQLEWLAVTLPSNPMFLGGAAAGAGQAVVARNQARAALGIAAGAQPQAVIDGLAGAAEALPRNDRAAVAAALPPAIFTLGAEATVGRLAEPPRVPAARAALAAIGSGAEEIDVGLKFRF